MKYSKVYKTWRSLLTFSFAILFCVTFLFSSCQQVETPLVTRAMVAVDESISEPLKEAISAFCSDVNRFSHGTLSLSVQFTDSAVREFRQKNSVFLFEDSKRIIFLDSNLKFVSSPFLYKNYHHFTMSIHSEQVLSLFEPSLKEHAQAVPLGAFFQESSHLLSAVPIAKKQDIIQLTQTQKTAEMLAKDFTNTSDYFRAIGFTTLTNPSARARKNALENGTVQVAEFSTSELLSIDWSGLDLIYTPSFHTVDMHMLLAGQEFFSSLTSQQKAAVNEALSYMYARAEEYSLLREEMMLSKLQRDGVILSSLPVGLWEYVEDSTHLIRSYDDDDGIGTLLYERIDDLSKNLLH